MNKRLVDFQRSSSFYGKIDLLCTIKSFNVREIRKRYLDSKSNKNNRTGAVERRASAKGGVCQLSISDGKLIQHELITDLVEPRGVIHGQSVTAFAFEREVLLIQQDKETLRLTHPWFSYLHSVDLSDTHLLVASSGFDCIFEFDLLTNRFTTEWFAWDHGIDRAKDPETGEDIYLCRTGERQEEYNKAGKTTLLIDDPVKQILPTAKRAAFINSVSYTRNNKVLATFFHEGKVYEIDLHSGEVKERIAGLNSPHGGFDKHKLMATSTASGQVWIEGDFYDFEGLPNKAKEMEGMEWVQNTISLNKSTFISIDSNRSAFVIFDIDKNLFDMIHFDQDWAVQDLIPNTFGFNLKEHKNEF